MFDPSYYKIYYSNSLCQNCLYYLDTVSNLSIDTKASFSDNFSLGGVESAYIVNSPKQTEVSFTSDVIRDDSFIKFTGENFICKFYFYDKNCIYNINNLYLNSYSASFTVGALPTINTKFTSYGHNIQNVNSIPSSISGAKLYNSNIIKLNAISLSGNNISGIIDAYNILSFDYTMAINRQPYYSVGSASASQVELINPSRINFSITSKIKDSCKHENVSVLNCIYSFSVLVSGCNYLIRFPIKNSIMSSSSIISSSQNTLEIKREYIGYLGI